ncbi:membrane-associated protein, putative [Bodo saltans]|uniref:Membrane-associated protein, putative n=1 Tax=Bodo saltans TaxID=75058 RepID=A0A0S4J9W4_BODSA|nr:membrane-associated protein, putative [Bodo saltans]|eukprot:CUG88103.1 membrane-associated protein, putative [Bodo saltans]
MSFPRRSGILLVFCALIVAWRGGCYGAKLPQVGDLYRGGYFCVQGYTNVNVYVQNASSPSMWTALFTFSVPTSPYCTGAYIANITGSGGATLTMEGSSWVSNPCGYSFLPPFTFSIQGTTTMPVWYTESVDGVFCDQFIVGKSTLRRPCSGTKNSTSVLLTCVTESASWTELQSKTISSSFALPSTSSSRSSTVSGSPAARTSSTSDSAATGSNASTMTVSATNQAIVQMTVSETNQAIVPNPFSSPRVRSVSSVAIGVTISVGSVLGVGSYAGAVHGIQAAMLVIRVQTLCASNSRGVEEAGGGGDALSPAATPDDLCCDLGTSPTQLTLPDYGGVYLGGVLGNCAIVAIATIMRFAVGKTVHSLAVGQQHAGIDQQTCFTRILPYLRKLAPPSGPVTLSWTPYMFLLCPTVSLCIALVSDGTVPLYAQLVAGCLFPLLLVPWAGAFAGLCWWWGQRVTFAFGRVEPQKYSKATDKSTKKRIRRSPLGEAHAWLFEVTEELAPRYGEYFNELAREQLRRFGSVFASYRAARCWYFNIEAGFAIATGVATGLMLRQMSSTDPCAGTSGWAWAVVGVGIVETMIALIVRAFALRLELAVFASVMTLTILSEAAALLDPNEVEVANGLSTAAAVLQVLAVLYGAFEHFLLRRRISYLNTSVQLNDSLQIRNEQLSAPLHAKQYSLGGTVRRSSSMFSHPQSLTEEESAQYVNILEDMIEMICAGRLSAHSDEFT